MSLEQEFHDDPRAPEKKSMLRSTSGGGLSGTSYDRWSYEQSTRAGAGAHDTPLNKLQHKYWVTKSKVVRKLGKEEDECVVASDAELDSKLYLYKSIIETTMDLQRILEQYNDRLCNLAFEENCMGRFLKDFGKLDKTRAGKMMIASGKAISYSSQQRLALRPSILRLAEEVDTFRFRAIEDTHETVKSMEKVRTDYRGALMWMKNVSTELDPDTYKQLEKFRKVQGHVKFSKQKFDKLKVDCLQKVDLLAAARCNMYSHALVMYQDALINFCDKVAKTFTHVEQSFKGYQPYEFQYIKELAEPTRMLQEMERKTKKRSAKPAVNTDASQQQQQEDLLQQGGGNVNDEKYFFDPDEEAAQNVEQGVDALQLAQQSEASLNNLLELGDNDEGDDELLLQWSSSQKTSHGQQQGQGDQYMAGYGGGNFDLLSQMDKGDSKLLQDLIGNESPSKDSSEGDSPSRFSTQWNTLFGDKAQGATATVMDESNVPDLRLDTLGQDDDDFGSFFTARQDKKTNNSQGALLPSQLFDLDQSLFSKQTPRAGPHDLLSDFPMPSPARPASVQQQLDLLHQKEEDTKNLDLMGQLSLETVKESSPLTSNAKSAAKIKGGTKDMSQWFSLFADLDPLANPDAIGKTTKESDPNCYS